MIEGKTVLGLITARGGSKRVLKKNIRPIGGKPLIAYTIEAARQSKFIDRLILSSDDLEIIKIGKFYGCETPFVRPADLAKDDTPGIEPVVHAIETIPEKYDYIVLLQPTSPLRTTEDVDGCIHFCIKNSANACVSITEAEKSPFWMFTLNQNQSLISLINEEKSGLSRQELPEIYVINGAVYIAKSGWLLKNRTFISEDTLAYLMPISRSLDIDTEWDITVLEKLLEKGCDD